MENKKIEKVKSDLRRLRKIYHSIEVAMVAKERHEKMLQHIKKAGYSEDECEKIERNIRMLRIDSAIGEATILEEKYMKAISELDPLDRTIILDGYVNGKPYWKIGREIGYTEVGIQKRASKALKILANLL